jgi:hypothetical protein
LSVYLGLVLVGGAPQVFAQAALTRDFDIKNEIEFKDDLDNKPDNETNEELSAKSGEQDNQFVEEYARTVSALLKRVYFPKAEGYEPTVNSHNAFLETGSEISNDLFPKVSKDLDVVNFNWAADKDKFFVNFKLKSKFENKDVSSFVSSFNSSLNFLRCESQNKTENIILKNTEITFENNQVFIVTHFARASIDEFLTKNVAR